MPSYKAIKGYKWSHSNFTYSLDPKNSTYHYLVDFDKPDQYGNEYYVQSVMKKWADVADIQFSVNDKNPDIGMYEAHADVKEYLGTTYFAGIGVTGTLISDVDIYINVNDNDFKSGEKYFTYMHELGHALGLQHPDDDGFKENYDQRMTVMSYNEWGVIPKSPMYFDIQAIQEMYGVNEKYNNKNNQINIDGSAKIFTIWDGGGVDVINASGVITNSTIDLRNNTKFINGIFEHQSWVSDSKFWIAYGANIEDAIGGSGNDTIYGSDFFKEVTIGNAHYVASNGDNKLSGGVGNDTMYGLSGNDTLTGGKGDDVLVGGVGNDKYFWRAGDGNDVITDGDGKQGNDTLTIDLTGSGVNADTVNFTHQGNQLAIAIPGGIGSVIRIPDYYAAAGNQDKIVIKDDKGSHTPDPDNLADGDHAGGIDSGKTATGLFKWESKITEKILPLTEGFPESEQPDFQGIMAVDEFDFLQYYRIIQPEDRLFYEGLKNLPGPHLRLHENFVNVLGGMVGIFVEKNGDAVQARMFIMHSEVTEIIPYVLGEPPESAPSTVYKTFNDYAGKSHSIYYNPYTWGEGDVELGGGITGDSADDIIPDANGGHTAPDAVTGIASGSDARETVKLSAAGTAFGFGGADRLNGSSGNDQLYGGDGDDRVYGSHGSDMLDGGTGDDFLNGGTGDDQYAIDTAHDRVIERNGGGTDTVVAGVSYTLAAYVENLNLMTDANLNGHGNAQANRMMGNGGANRLYGGVGDDVLYGGKGVDKLTGGADNDIFHFKADDSGVGRGHRDIITDFTPGGDKIAIDGIGELAWLGSTRFHAGDGAQARYYDTTHDRILAFDTDGDGLKDFEIQFTGKLDVTESDFV